MRSFMSLSLIIILQACQTTAPQYTAGKSGKSPGEIKPAPIITTEKPFQSIGGNGGNAEQTAYQGRYLNEVYGYSIEIPKGLRGEGVSPPAPNHGVTIILSEQPEARIWTDGSFNSLFWSSLDEAVADRIEGNRNVVSQVEVIKRSNTRLHDLNAVHLTLRHKDRGASEFVVEDVVLALRDTKDEVGIVYSISLTTVESRYNRDKEVFDEIVRSWRVRHLPE